MHVGLNVGWLLLWNSKQNLNYFTKYLEKSPGGSIRSSGVKKLFTFDAVLMTIAKFTGVHDLALS
jgi:hypothetical protein